MPFDWKEYLDLALLLQKQSSISQEALLRSAVGRAYYAAFCHAQNYACNQLGFVPPTRNRWKNHLLVRDHFRKLKMTSIANHLDKLRKWRNQCDYDDVVPNIPTLCANAIKRAQKLLGAIP